MNIVNIVDVIILLLSLFVCLFVCSADVLTDDSTLR